MRFTDRAIKALKPKDKFYEARDQNGFVLRVQPTGTKTFYYLYDYNGKRKRVKIGDYGDPPLLSLAEARERHAHLVRVRQSGDDPGLGNREKRAATVEQLCKEYIDHYARRKKKTWEADQRALDRDVIPAIGNKIAGDVKRSDIVSLLEKIHARGVERQVNIVHTILGKAFSFGLQRGFPGLEYNPCRDIQRIGKENERDRVLSPDEIRIFWDALSAAQRLSDSTKRCLRTILITGQRPGECLNMERSEISGDWWTIPKEKYKTDIVHRVYLTGLAKQQIGKRGKPFPVPADHRALNRAVSRICKDKKLERFTPHDLRRTAATLMAENGVIDDHVDRVLGHKMGKIRRTYNRHSFDEEKMNALLVLESSLLKILKKSSSSV